ncbi:ABC transporter ATP-binding protein [Fusobacterium ulcerans]|uniref:ABC transporter ATP-binding protein n=1 Tax=Fusobacterium ulcerans TaxID=861 RepID=UPI001D0AD839|nr:dipeptide/oligopeptide/nickel ABC transporter ATP-binding protein [Fusobacterium ulcerans]MCB8566540.1 dipeptide/oligopeptide/nickel ABC transporter ATP-binding protein [Fusobacterium ulcerans]MCB8650699.1 dipeptide/oligopeptide/nickel ABC transporter ATP-binding protein [Fusobacterium ulcerans]
MLLEAKNIFVSFKKENQTSFFGKERQEVVKDVSISLKKGECLGIIGESGSGKSTFGKTLIGLLTPDKGDVTVNRISLYGKSSRDEKRKVKQAVSVVFQDYTSSANPRFRIKDIIGESLRVIEKRENIKIDKKKRTEELLELVGLNKNFIDRYPHELSGGQLQRVCIARAVATNPEIILLDEAISSLDASTQTQVMDLLKNLQKEFGFSYIFITHDLPSVTYMCDRVIFFYDGKIVEQVDDIYMLSEVKSSYAAKLLHSILEIDIQNEEQRSYAKQQSYS